MFSQHAMEKKLTPFENISLFGLQKGSIWIYSEFEIWVQLLLQVKLHFKVWKYESKFMKSVTN